MIRYKSIKTRMYVQVTLLILSVLLISDLSLYVYFRNTLNEQASVDRENAIKQSAANLDNVANELDQIALYLCADKMIPQMLEGTPNAMIDRMNLATEIKTRFAVYTNGPITAQTIDYNATLFISDEYPIYDELAPYKLGESYKTMVSVNNDKLVKEEEWYRKTVELNNSFYSFRLNGNDNMIYFSKLIRNINFLQSTHSDVVGVMVMGFKSHIIQQMLEASKITDDTELLWLYQDSVIEATSMNNIGYMSTVPEEYAGIMELSTDGQLHAINIDRAAYMVSRTPMSWKFELVTVIPQASINHKLKEMSTLMLLQLLVVIAIGMAILYGFTNKYTKPIIKLANAMEGVNDEVQMIEFDTTVPYNDEIGTLYHSYHRMLNRIYSLITEIKESLTREHEAELRALQAQINPHFIYNTLDSINWLAICEKQDNISVMATSLTDILRYSINEPNSMVTLKDELLHLSKYLRIQRLYTNDKFSFTVNIRQDFWDVSLPKLTLQPLIENALFYASNSTNYIQIILSAENFGNILKITVNDNGTNTEPDAINNFLNGSDNIKARGKGIAIRNVNNRIKMHFGAEYGLYYVRHNDGISATVSIPLKYTSGRPMS